MIWFRCIAVTATVIAAGGLATPAYADPTGTDCSPAPGVECGAELDLDNPLRPRVHGEVGFERLDVNVGTKLIPDYMTLGFGADADGQVLGNQASVNFNRRGDKARACIRPEQASPTCIRR